MAEISKEVVDLDESVPATSIEVSDQLPTGTLPLAKIKRIIKLNPKAQNVSADSVKLIQLCAEQYLHTFVTMSARICEQSGRKTIQPKDLDSLIANDRAFELLEDTLFDWPDPKPKTKAANLTISPNLRTEEVEIEERPTPEPCLNEQEAIESIEKDIEDLV